MASAPPRYAVRTTPGRAPGQPLYFSLFRSICLRKASFRVSSGGTPVPHKPVSQCRVPTQGAKLLHPQTRMKSALPRGALRTLRPCLSLSLSAVRVIRVGQLDSLSAPARPLAIQTNVSARDARPCTVWPRNTPLVFCRPAASCPACPAQRVADSRASPFCWRRVSRPLTVFVLLLASWRHGLAERAKWIRN